MAKVESFNRETVISDLVVGRDYVHELKQVFRSSDSIAASRERWTFFLEKIVSNFDNVIAKINCVDLPGNEERSVVLDSPHSSVGSVRRDRSDRDSIKKNASKKRKTLPSWKEQVHETGVEGQVDGYYWRKYGQKDILGASHPRAYYRCTHRDTQGCLATKHVQRKEEDPSVFEVIYRGQHTCVQQRLKRRKDNTDEKKKQVIKTDYSDRQIMSFTISKPDLKVDIQEMRTEDLPSTSNGFFWEPDNFIEPSCSPPIFSPQTSESYLSQSSRQMTDIDGLWDFSSSVFESCWMNQVNFDSPSEGTPNIL